MAGDYSQDSFAIVDDGGKTEVVFAEDESISSSSEGRSGTWQTDTNGSRDVPASKLNVEKQSDGRGGTTIGDEPASSKSGPTVSIGGDNDTFLFHAGESAQMANNAQAQHAAVAYDLFGSGHDVEELVAAVTPYVHTDTISETGHGDAAAAPGMSSTYLQQNLRHFTNLHG
jgi:hypothetical protein